MVPIEQLSDGNFLNVYYIASEIKRELEIVPDRKEFIDIKKSYLYNPNQSHYPCFFDKRFQTVSYLFNIGEVGLYQVSGKSINIKLESHEKFFLFCNRLAKIYSDKFSKHKSYKEKIDELADEQVRKIMQVMDTIFFKFENEKESNSSIFIKSLLIPYNHFPASIDVFEINGIIYKLANDFKVIAIKKNPINWLAKNEKYQDTIDIEFESNYTGNFMELRDIINEKYQSTTASKENSTKIDTAENQTNDVKSILLITPQYNNFDFFWIVFNHDYEKKHKLSMVNKQTKQNDGIGYNLWKLCEEKQVDFDASFLNYMNGKIFKVKAFGGFNKTKLVQVRDQKILINSGIVLEKKSKELLEKDILKHFT